jgi:hypothetical protein
VNWLHFFSQFDKLCGVNFIRKSKERNRKRLGHRLCHCLFDSSDLLYTKTLYSSQKLTDPHL